MSLTEAGQTDRLLWHGLAQAPLLAPHEVIRRRLFRCDRTDSVWQKFADSTFGPSYFGQDLHRF